MQQPQGVRPPGGVHRDVGEGVQRALSRVVEQVHADPLQEVHPGKYWVGLPLVPEVL